MPLLGGTSIMSLGTWTARTIKYQMFLNLSNVLMLIVSTLLLFLAAILIHFYHLTKVPFLHFLLSYIYFKIPAWLLVLVFLCLPNVYANLRCIHIGCVCLWVSYIQERIKVNPSSIIPYLFNILGTSSPCLLSSSVLPSLSRYSPSTLHLSWGTSLIEQLF